MEIGEGREMGKLNEGDKERDQETEEERTRMAKW